MISNGQKTLRKASRYLGAMESPPGSNRGKGIVDDCQALYGLQGVPWCACFVGYCIAESDADAAYKRNAKSVVHPSTAEMVRRARAKGWYTTGNARTRPGDLFIIDGRHVGFVNRVRNDGRFETIEGNASDGVRSLLRAWSDGWRVISIPGVGAPGPAAVVNGYGFDDTRVKIYGGWPTAAQRDAVMRKYEAANPDHWTQAIKVRRPSKYAFRSGPKGTYNRWTFGPWLHGTGKQIRDEQMEKWKETHDAKARPWRKTYREN